MEAHDAEQPLPGGNVSTGIVRAGDTVRRPTGPHMPRLRALLLYLHAAGFEGAPRPLGINDRGREVLTFLPGTVPRPDWFDQLEPQQRTSAPRVRLPPYPLTQTSASFHRERSTRMVGLSARRPKYPPVLLAAGAMAAEGVSFLLVGSAALWLRGLPIHVADVDLVIEPGEQNLRHLRAVLRKLALRSEAVPSVTDLRWQPLVSVPTSYGHIDCLLERGRVEWNRLCHGAEVLPVADAGVLTAAVANVCALRLKFKQ